MARLVAWTSAAAALLAILLGVRSVWYETHAYVGYTEPGRSGYYSLRLEGGRVWFECRPPSTSYNTCFGDPKTGWDADVFDDAVGDPWMDRWWPPARAGRLGNPFRSPVAMDLAVWVLSVALAGVSGLCFGMTRRRGSMHACARCGYDAAGLEVCPECGKPVSSSS
ncbi:MAG: hypothetical protein R3B49_00340 [Phycisphaerales bacterium]